MQGNYTIDNTPLFERLKAALQSSGKDASKKGSLTAEDFNGVDELHIGGMEATKLFMSNISKVLGAKPRNVLDLGCGIGGPARAMASAFDCAVLGIDLTPDFVTCAEQVSELAPPSKGSVSFQVGSILDLNLPYEKQTFDVATLIHVGMNIENKDTLFSQVYRVLRPGGIFAVYDVMLEQGHTASELTYPLPWASEQDHSFVRHSNEYIEIAKTVGFQHPPVSFVHRGEMAKEFFCKMQEKMMNQAPQPMSMQVIFGHNTKDRVKNISQMINSEIVAPYEIMFKKSV